ncbi:hypothetical protein I5Q34_25600 [Streptomyces sp. AV19]|uniref:hypothetical protein n=1 Tax=Streptomyces sp. AV19 TaxID=2793068 RepID=UPI0018FE468A|nr:hypothetical protein [Streptomyces sp. AV19]MBH1937606.1 hypothetical protein [Streptomyces sp. AV19]MDG4536461.1 hypothetical protein [Streptomyces sp. AV19]
MRNFRKRALAPVLLTAFSLALAGCSTSGGGSTAASDEVANAGQTGAPSVDFSLETPSPGKASPGAVAIPAGGGLKAQKPAVKVDSIDEKSGRAVITDTVPPDAPGPSGKPAPSAPSTTPAAKKKPVAVGDIIASKPVPGAPKGVLAKVTKVEKKTSKGTEVRTAPTDLSTVLGDSKVKSKLPVDPSGFKAEPLVPGVKFSYAKRGKVHAGPDGLKLPFGSLRVDVDTKLDTEKNAKKDGPDSPTKAAFKGFVQLAPEIDFNYYGRGSGDGPSGAGLRLTGDWSSGFHFKGRTSPTTNGKPVRVPFVVLHANPTFYIGELPVTVNIDLTCYVLIDADGKVSLDVQQDPVKGDFTLGSAFGLKEGWQPEAKANFTPATLKASTSAAADVKVRFGTEANLGLYGSVGVKGDVAAPYVRTEVKGGVSGSTEGRAAADVDWKLFAGVDLEGWVMPYLKIGGVQALAMRLPMPKVQREVQLAHGKGAIRVPQPRTPQDDSASGRKPSQG